MMVDLTVLIRPNVVNTSVKKDLKERDCLGKDQPYINHLKKKRMFYLSSVNYVDNKLYISYF